MPNFHMVVNTLIPGVAELGRGFDHLHAVGEFTEQFLSHLILHVLVVERGATQITMVDDNVRVNPATRPILSGPRLPHVLPRYPIQLRLSRSVSPTFNLALHPREHR